MKRVLDAWALIALIRDEAAASRVQQELSNAHGVISWINLGEVHYQLTRSAGVDKADRVLQYSQRVLSAELPDEELVVEASAVKARGGVAYADCFAIATAARHDSPLLTGDPEIIARATHIEVTDLR